jgi:hypothetical protein
MFFADRANDIASMPFTSNRYSGKLRYIEPDSERTPQASFLVIMYLVKDYRATSTEMAMQAVQLARVELLKAMRKRLAPVVMFNSIMNVVELLLDYC